MFPLLLILGAAALAYGFSKSSAPTHRVIPGPAGANVQRLPAGSMVMTHGFDEAITILKGHIIKPGDAGLAAIAATQGGLPQGFDMSDLQHVGETLYNGRTLISGRVAIFLSSDITLIQNVTPAVFIDEPF